MQPARKPAPRFTAGEKDILVELVTKYKNIIECKETDVSSLNAKLQAWIRLSTEYNCNQGVSPRDVKQLKKCWENMKRKAKEEDAREKKWVHKTGKPCLLIALKGRWNWYLATLANWRVRRCFGLYIYDIISEIPAISTVRLLLWGNE